MAIRSVGTFQTYATIKAAWDQCNNGDTIRLTSNINEPNGTYLGGGKNLITIESTPGSTFTITHTGFASFTGWMCMDQVGTRWLNINFVNSPTSRGLQGGSAINLSAGAAYILVENCEISYYIQAGVNINPGRYQGRNNEGAEFLWVNKCNIHHIDPNASFTNSGSLVSTYQPQVVSGAAMPQWWSDKLAAEISVPQEHYARSSANLAAIVTNNILWWMQPVPPFSTTDTDENGIIHDDWQCVQAPGGTANNYCTARPGAWSLNENNRVWNTRGAGVRIFGSSTNANPCPHVIRHNTLVDTGKRLSAAYGFAIGAAISIGTQGAGMSNPGGQQDYHALVIHNSVHTAANGYALAFTVTDGAANNNHQVLMRDNHYFNTYDEGPGHLAGWGATGLVTGDPLLQSTTDPNLFIPGATSPLIGAAGANQPIYDALGNVRSNNTIGAIDGTGGPPPAPGDISIISSLTWQGTKVWAVPNEVIDGDLVIAISTLRSSNDIGAGLPNGHNPTALQAAGWTLLYDAFTQGTWSSQGFAFAKVVTVTEAGTVLQMTHSDTATSEFSTTVVHLRGNNSTPIVVSFSNAAAFFQTSIPVTITGTVPDGGAALWIAHIQDEKSEPGSVTSGVLYTPGAWHWHSTAYSFRSWETGPTNPSTTFNIPDNTDAHVGGVILAAGAPTPIQPVVQAVAASATATVRPPGLTVSGAALGYSSVVILL